jgi:hypothetical protein
MDILITNPRAHREAWVRRNPQCLIEHGGIVSHEDLERWACDICMAPLDPDQPIRCLGGPEGRSLCERCAPAGDYALCQCEGCRQSPATSPPSKPTMLSYSKHYALADTSKGWFRRHLTALAVLENVGYRVELSTLVDDDSEREAWTVGRMNRHLEQRGARSADEAAEMFLESMLGESRITGFEGDIIVMPDDDLDDWIEEQDNAADFREVG